MNYLSREFAEKQAEENIVQYFKSLKTSIKIPIDPCHVAEILWNTDTIFLERGSLGTGIMAQANIGENKIYIEESGYEARDRFSIAHEVGHFSLHTYLLGLNERSYKKELYYEYQADAYASALLMPKQTVIDTISRDAGFLDDDNCKVDLIKNKFQVSRTAAKIRLENLNLILNPNIKKNSVRYDKKQQEKRDTWIGDL